MRTSTLILAPLALLLALNLVACGNKGPLVRPSADDIEDVQDVEPIPAAEPAVDAAPPIDGMPVEEDDQDDDADTPPLPADASDG